MSDYFYNEYKQPLDIAVDNWQGASTQYQHLIHGQYVGLQRLDIKAHEKALYQCLCTQENNAGWTYLSYGPFDNFSDFQTWLNKLNNNSDLTFYVVLVNNEAKGMLSYLNNKPEAGSIEIGHIHFSAELKQTREATEAIYLLIKQAFDNNNRRVEWICHSLNAASKKAAQRFGFLYEGTLRQARVVKGRNRHTNIYSILDNEWADISKAYTTWLSPNNFDNNHQQQQTLKTRL